MVNAIPLFPLARHYKRTSNRHFSFPELSQIYAYWLTHEDKCSSSVRHFA